MRSALLGYDPVVQSDNPLYAFESNRSVAPTEVRDYDSDTVVQLARVTALSCQAAVQRSSSRELADLTSKRLTETQRRIAESQDRIRRTDRLLTLIQQEMVYQPVKRNSESPSGR